MYAGDPHCPTLYKDGKQFPERVYNRNAALFEHRTGLVPGIYQNTSRPYQIGNLMIMVCISYQNGFLRIHSTSFHIKTSPL